MTLNAKHAEHLSRFRIAEDVIDANGVRSVADVETRALFGVGEHQHLGVNLSGILFPCLDPLTGLRTGGRVRLDVPVGGIKYFSEQGNRHLFFAHPIPRSWLTDPAIPIFLVEAEKSGLALASLSGRMAGQELIAIALGGCWGWKRKNGKELQPDGKQEPTTGPSPDFDLINWTGRPTVILFDANVATNFDVQMARGGLSRYLLSLGAKVFHAEVPVIPGCNGPDDFISQSTDTEAAERMLRKITPYKLPPAEAKEKKPNEAQEVVNAAMDAGLNLFHSPDEVAYVGLEIGGHREIWPLRSRRFKNHLAYLTYERKRRVTSANGLHDALATLEGKAMFEGEEQQVYVRLAAHEGSIFLDLANENWQAVHIDAEGWKVVNDPPVRFIRQKGMLSLPLPMRGGEIGGLRQFLNLEDDDFVLVASFLVACLRPSGPYPVLVICSEQGSGKTTMSRMIRALVDPNFAPTRSEPKEPRDVAIACRNSHMVALDNVSKLQDWLSDTLARVSTGDAFATRALYTDSDETLFAASRPVLLNGITAVPRRADLLDRSILVTAKTIPDEKRRPEDELWAEFDTAKPGILAGLLDAVSIGLRRIGEVRLDRLPRMADFAKWMTAAEPAMPWEPGVFMEIYTGNRQDAIEEILEGDPVADMARRLALTHAEGWEGTAGDFLGELNRVTPDSVRTRKDWYSKPKQVSDHLSRITTNLRRIGIEVSHSKSHHPRLIYISAPAASPAASPASLFGDPASPLSDSKQSNGDDGDARDAEIHTLSNPNDDGEVSV